MVDELYFKISTIKTKQDVIAMKGLEEKIAIYVHNINKKIETNDLLKYSRIGEKRYYEINENVIHSQILKTTK